MFDTMGAFKKQFTPVEGGYLVYPSKKLGGKLVTDAEYERLVSDWQRVAGRAGRWKVVGAVVAVIAVWTLLSDLLSAPDWANSVLTALIVSGMSAWLIWASTAPRRLVKDRAPVTAPRPVADARREARGALNWPFVAFALLISGSLFVSNINADERTVGTWAWLIGSGAMLGLYMWIGFKKLLDGRR
jgi:hypothetical protein